MRFGICCGPGSFVPQAGSEPLSSIPALMETMQAAGADYLEFAVGAVMPEGGAGEFEKLHDALQPYPTKVEAFNSFIPGRFRLTGPEVNWHEALDYCGTALARCKALGGTVVVLGSAGARKVPEGFDRDEALRQFVGFCRELGPVAAAAGVDVALEPLNRREDNLLLSVSEGARLVDEIGHPRIQLLADLYHMVEEGEPLAHVAAAGARLRHTHVADLGRVAPGCAPEGETDFAGFFANLRQAGYNARCSFEGRFDDIATQTKPLLDLLRQRWSEAGGR